LLGAFLLFLTNLAAIAFSFALIARLSGAARPLANVEITPRYVIAGLAAFGVLATPLGVTLYRVTAEARAQATVRRLLTEELNLKPVNIAQLQVRWPLRGAPSVDAVVIASQYTNDAEQRLLNKLEAEWGERPSLNLQQVVAADVQAQTRAIVDAAVETSAAGIARDVPPLIAIREAVGLPTQALWVNRTERTVQVVPFSADGWQLGDYREAEMLAQKVAGGWNVHLIPPVRPSLFVAVDIKDGAPLRNPSLDDAIWAIERWGVQGIQVTGFATSGSPDQRKTMALSFAQFAVGELTKSGIDASASTVPADHSPRADTASDGVEFEVVRKPPKQRVKR
jgi:hypothetical protein